MFPSIKRLQAFFDIDKDKATLLRDEMERAWFGNWAAARVTPRMNQLLDGSGVESFETRRMGYCAYVNMGDAYARTLLAFRGRYVLGDWGSIAERYGTEGD